MARGVSIIKGCSAIKGMSQIKTRPGSDQELSHLYQSYHNLKRLGREKGVLSGRIKNVESLMKSIGGELAESYKNCGGAIRTIRSSKGKGKEKARGDGGRRGSRSVTLEF